VELLLLVEEVVGLVLFCRQVGHQASLGILTKQCAFLKDLVAQSFKICFAK